MKSGTQKLKKFLAFVMTVVMVLTAVPLGGLTFSASAENEGYYTYTVENGEATITDCDESISGEVVIPDTLGGYPVTSIGGSAFRGCTDLTSITIPDSVTSIGEYAFFYCTGLTSITIPDSVTSIGSSAFEGCTGLTSVTIPDSVTSIGSSAFEGCTGLTSITIPDSVTSIGEYAFAWCESLTSITIPDSVTSIELAAFKGCTGLTSIKIPDSVTGIGSDAFSDCTGLTNITVSPGNTVYHSTDNCLIETKSKTLMLGCKNSVIPSDGSVTSIGGSAFEGCTGLTSITIPDSVTSIGDWAFEGCTGLTSVMIPNSVTSIAYSAFRGCTGLTSITIPDSVTIIVQEAFRGCTGLTSITIPNSVTSISVSAFYGCTNLTSITIPDSVTSIGSSAFEGCTGLTSITIPDGVTRIAGGAFAGCTGLTSITIPDSVTSIGDWAFWGCTGLRSITIPDSVTSIGYEVFYNTAYYDNDSNWEDDVLYIGNHLIDAKYSISGDYDIKDGTKTISKDAFFDCTGLTSITIPDSVTSIGEYAFRGCTGLTNITIPASVTDIGDYAFGYYYESTYELKKVENFTIYGYTGTAAETYANKNGFAFIALEEEHTHTYSDWVVITEATCTAEGEETRTCSVCGASETRPVERKTHTFGAWVTTKQATVFESGVRIRTCTGCGKVSETNPINKVSSIKLSKTSFTYNGKVQKPTVTVKDSKGTALKNGRDYTVKYSSGRKDVGTYSVTVTMKGIYSGSKKLSFSILPQGTSIESLSASSAGFTAKWKKKTNQITGYQLQYSTSNSFKSVKTITIKKNSDTSRSVSNLKGRTKYYVRVRTYKKVGNKNYYSSWSSAKTVATKPVTGVEILSSATIYVGGSKTLSAKTYPTKVTVKWKSSNTSVAKVSSNGKVTAIKKGKATITAYFAYGGKTYKANCAVTVKSRNPKIK